MPITLLEYITVFSLSATSRNFLIAIRRHPSRFFTYRLCLCSCEWVSKGEERVFLCVCFTVGDRWLKTRANVCFDDDLQLKICFETMLKSYSIFKFSKSVFLLTSKGEENETATSSERVDALRLASASIKFCNSRTVACTCGCAYRLFVCSLKARLPPLSRTHQGMNTS